MGNPAYDVVHVQGLAGDRLAPAYNMDNNPLYEMRIMSNERHSHKTAGPHVYKYKKSFLLNEGGQIMKNKWNKRLHTPSIYLCTTVTGQ